MHQMSLTQFSVHLGLYDEPFTRTPEYNALLIERPIGESIESCWHHLSTFHGYDPRREKATSLYSSTLRYIHHLLSHSLTGWGDSSRVVSQRDFSFLLSMVDRSHLHLGHKIILVFYH